MARRKRPLSIDEKHVMTRSDRAFAWGEIEIELCNKGHLHQAMFASAAAAAIEPENPYNWYGMGKVAYLAGEFHVASCCFERAVTIDRKEDLVRYLFVDALYSSGQYQRCIVEAKKAIRHFGVTRECLEYLGLAWQELGNFNTAARWFKKAELLGGDSILEDIVPSSIEVATGGGGMGTSHPVRVRAL